MKISQIRSITENPDNPLCLDSLLDRFEDKEKLPQKELALLYYGHALNIDYKPMLFYMLEIDIIKANTNRKYKKASKLCDSLLFNHPVNMIALEEKAYCKAKLQDTAESKHAQFLYDQIRGLILGSGDGLSQKTAYKITTMKEIEFITDIRGMQVLSRKSIKKEGFFYEVCKVYHKGEKKNIYFNTSLINLLGNSDF